ncbi:MAG: MoaD/ThiS family protein [Chitinophagales bacterium]
MTILAFGIAKEIFGSSSMKMELKGDITVNDLKNLLEEKFPKLKQLSSFKIALNNHFAAHEEMINESDEIAIIPPVSGG